MSSLATLRQDLKEALEEQDLKAVEYLPERIQPPIALVSASDPYLEQGLTACLFKVSLEVTLVAAKATNANSTNALDDMIESAIYATGDWFIDTINAPFILEANNAQYLACKMRLNQQIEIGG